MIVSCWCHHNHGLLVILSGYCWNGSSFTDSCCSFITLSGGCWDRSSFICSCWEGSSFIGNYWEKIGFIITWDAKFNMITLSSYWLGSRGTSLLRQPTYSYLHCSDLFVFWTCFTVVFLVSFSQWGSHDAQYDSLLDNSLARFCPHLALYNLRLAVYGSYE